MRIMRRGKQTDEQRRSNEKEGPKSQTRQKKKAKRRQRKRKGKGDKINHEQVCGRKQNQNESKRLFCKRRFRTIFLLSQQTHTNQGGERGKKEGKAGHEQRRKNKKEMREDKRKRKREESKGRKKEWEEDFYICLVLLYLLSPLFSFPPSLWQVGSSVNILKHSTEPTEL
jgi:hypothetical protein